MEEDRGGGGDGVVQCKLGRGRGKVVGSGGAGVGGGGGGGGRGVDRKFPPNSRRLPKERFHRVGEKIFEERKLLWI